MTTFLLTFSSVKMLKLCQSSRKLVSLQKTLFYMKCDSHTDITIPDFSADRPKRLNRPNVKSDPGVDDRKLVTAMVSGTGMTASLYCTKEIVLEHVLFMGPSRDVLAMAKIEIKLADIPEGVTQVFKWRGKPLFVKHRTHAEIAREESEDITKLRDPQRDQDRCKKPEWLIVVGVCTHAGCIPLIDTGDFPGGSYCPCHGAHYDGSGRVRKGPAPRNLEVPDYEFIDETVVVG